MSARAAQPILQAHGLSKVYRTGDVSIAIVVPAAVFAWGEPTSLLLLSWRSESRSHCSAPGRSMFYVV